MRKELFYEEQISVERTLAFLSSKPENLEKFLAPVFNPDGKKIQGHKRREYKQYFYSEGTDTKKHTASRRYWARPEILGWDIFQLEASAAQAGAHLSYAAYTAFIKENVSHLKIAEIILKLAHCFLTGEEVKSKKETPSEWWGWVHDVKIWYANSFIFTLWFGKYKEHFALPFLQEEAKKYGLQVFKTSSQKDKQYRIDFAALRWHENTQEWEPVFGISVKGLSWLYAQKSGANLYQSKGEVFEKEGHQKFREEYNAPVLIVVSDPESREGSANIIKTIQQQLEELAQDGTITLQPHTPTP